MKQQGFTLIELLVVIAVIGVLSSALLISINPGEQLARGRDSSRKSAISQLGHALESYKVGSTRYPDNDADWMTQLVTRREIKSIYPQISNFTGDLCFDLTIGHVVNNFCYVYNGSVAYVWTNVESKNEISKCGDSATSADVYYVYDTSLGRACIKCLSEYSGACNATQ